MKKTLFAALLLLGMSIMFASCDKTDINTEKETDINTVKKAEKALIGCWYSDEMGYYEFKKNGQCIGHSLEPYEVSVTYINGVLYTPSSGTWRESIGGQYEITGGPFLYEGETYYSVNIPGFIPGVELFFQDSNFIWVGDFDFYRIKDFRTRTEATDNEIYKALLGKWWDYYYYYEFSNGGIVKQYEIDDHNAEFELSNGVLYTNKKWEEGQQGLFEIKDGYLSIKDWNSYSTLHSGEVDILNNDEIRIGNSYYDRIKELR